MNTPFLNRRLPTPIRSIINRSVLRAIAALFIIDIGLWIAWIVSSVSGWPELVMNSLQQLAIALLTTAVITGVFERLVSRRLGEEITERTSEEARQIAERTGEETRQLSRAINDIVRDTDASGIVKIFPERLDSVEDIRAELEQATGEVLVAGVALPDFFVSGEQKFFEAIQGVLEDERAEVRALLLDPESEAAKEREEIEEHYKEVRYRLVERIRESCETIDSKTNGGWNIERRCYNHRPIAFMVCTGRCLFMEQYHCAVPSDKLRGPNIAGKVPLIQYSNESATYKIMVRHFEYVWENPKAVSKNPEA